MFFLFKPSRVFCPSCKTQTITRINRIYQWICGFLILAMIGLFLYPTDTNGFLGRNGWGWMLALGVICVGLFNRKAHTCPLCGHQFTGYPYAFPSTDRNDRDPNP